MCGICAKMLARSMPPCLLVFLTLIYKVSCQEGASLTFVIDDTRSMGDDIAQVRKNVDSIMDIVLNEKSSQISNIVLVTFNDPAVRVRKITRKREELKAAMARVKVNNYFNYDCPEMALSGIKLAIESSLPNSYIYVFTDASAKDYKLNEEIKQLCQRKQSQVTFVLTGNCRRPNSKRFKVYYEIAAASSGLAFVVNKNEVDAAIHTIHETIKGNKTVLTSQVTPPDEYTDIPFWIDDETEYAIVSASGTDVSLSIQGPKSAHLDTEKIMWTRNGKVMKIKRPESGKYVATVKGSSATSVVITGRSDFLFRHGFSEQEPKSIDDTAPQPLSHTLTHLSFLVTDPKHSVHIKSAQILGMKENVIQNLTLKELPSANFYVTQPFAAPDFMFKVALLGEAVQTGKPVRRIAKIPVTPQSAPTGTPLAKTPVVEIKEGASVEAPRGSALTLTCKVSAYPEPEITWTNDKGVSILSSTSKVQIPYDYISYLKIPKVSGGATYHCHAKNVLEKVKKAINVVTTDPITVKSIPEGTTKIAYGTDSTINCDVVSSLPLKIQWYHVNKVTGATEDVTLSNKYSVSLDGKQLNIRYMDVDLVGKYTCKVSVLDDPNEKKEISTNVEIYGLVAPKIDPGTQQIAVRENMPATIKCKILKAIPKPKITWQFKASNSNSYLVMPGSGDEIQIPRAGLQDTGSYRCVASNAGGSDEHTVAEVAVLTVPAVTIEEGVDVTVKYGTRVTLTCKVTAHPQPKIQWTDSQGKSLLALLSTSTNEFEYIYKAINITESGQFKCRAENDQGSDTKSIQVTVLPAFKVYSHPPDIIEIPYGNRVDLKCDIKSNLPMKIEWYYAADSASASTRLSSSDKYETSSDGTLKIKTMDLDLPGVYTCKASLIDDPNVTKSFATKIDIGGLVPPEIDPLPIKAKIIETNPAVITCKILRAVPKPKISWQLKASGATEYRSIAGSGSELHIEKTALANGGHYKCIAENAAGRRERVVAELEVLKAPEVAITEGASKEVPYSSLLTLTCHVTANPEPIVQWKDSAGNTLTATGTPVKSGFKYTHTLTRANVKVSDNFSCNAINDQGSNIKSIQVSVSSPFNVLSHPSDSTIGKYGNEVILKCDITSNLPMKIRWYHTKYSTNERKEIETSKQYTILSNGAELKINTMDIGLEGYYACKASLQEDPDENVEFATQVKISGLELPLVTGSGNKKVKVGASLSIKCNVVKGIPKPKLSLQFKPLNGDGKYEDVSYAGNEWLITNASVEDSGYYTCTARNILGSGVHIIALTVEEPARIITEEFSLNEGIIGDIALRIPCEAVGSPKPTFEWKVNGSVVTLGTKYVIEDGALIINHPERSDSQYTCTATNAAGSDTKTFRGVVDDTLSDLGTIHDIFILNGDTKDVTCTLPRSNSSTVKWFIEPQGTTSEKPYVTVEKAKLNDDGNYTCHVSDIHGSATETYVVDVGYPPKFQFPQDHLVEWSGDTEDVLSCSVSAKPEADVVWTFNGEPLVRESSMQLNILKWGQYSCNVSNVHGAVQRDFEVKPTVCLISRNKKDAPNLPLMLTEELAWPYLQTSGRYMIMKPGDKLLLSCHNREKSPNLFRNFPAVSELEATCDKGDTFTVNGKPYQLKDLHCTNKIYPLILKTGAKCMGDTSELIRVGYQLNEFLEAYEVCFDDAKNIPLHTRVLMSRTNDKPNAFSEWFLYPVVSNAAPDPYTCQLSSSICCYAKTQLASATDLSYGAAQNSSFIYPLNAVPLWRPCDLNRNTWENLENMVRSQLDINSNFVVWSGVHTLQEKNGTVIPRYLWKVVRESEDDSMAIVYVNDPSPTAADIKCSGSCSDKAPWFTTSDVYTYCCTVAEFLAAFHIDGTVVGESLDIDAYDQQIGVL